MRIVQSLKKDEIESPAKEAAGYRKREQKWLNCMDGDTARSYIEQYLSRMSDNDVCTMFLISLGSSMRYGGSGRDGQCLTEDGMSGSMGQILPSVFLASDIVSWLGKDDFLVFISRRIGEKELTDKVKEVCALIRRIRGTDGESRGRAGVGVYAASGSGLTFDDIFAQAAAALREAKNDRKRGYLIRTDGSDHLMPAPAGSAEKINKISLDTLIGCLGDGVALLEVGPEIRVIYASDGYFRMLGGDGEGRTLPCSLSRIGLSADSEADYEQVLRKVAKKQTAAEHVHRVSGDRKNWMWWKARVAYISYPSSRYPVLLELSTDASDMIRTERWLRESNEMLRVAFGQTPNVLWEVDIKKRTYNTFNVNEHRCSKETVIPGFPGQFFERGIIHPDSAEEFREFAEKILSGKEAGTGNFIMRDPVSDCFGWVALSYHMTYGRDGLPAKAVGTQVKLPGLAGIKDEIFPRRPLPEVIRHRLLLRMKVNLTADYIDEMWLEGRDQTAWTWGRPYSDVIKTESGHLFTRADAKLFEERFSREQLLEDYEKGNDWSVSEYRRVDGGGSVCWVRDAVNLVEDSRTKEVYMFFCLVDAQENHEWEALSRNQVIRSPETGLYSLRTSKELAEMLIAKNSADECAVVVIRLLGAQKQEENWERSDRIYRDLATALCFALGGDCVMGQDKKEELIAFFPQTGSRFDLQRRVEDAFAYVRVTMANMKELESMRFVAGAVTDRLLAADYDIMVLRASYLWELRQDSAMDTVVFPSEDEDWAWASLKTTEGKQEIHTRQDEDLSALTKEEQKGAFRCVTDMLKANSRGEALMNALRSIGEYYRAVRVYLVDLAWDSKIVTVLHEWKEVGRHGIGNVMSGVEIDKIPLLAKCLQEKTPISTESTASSVFYRGDVWRFLVFPLIDKDTVTGFLCVENARVHAGETALLYILTPYIMGEQKRKRGLTDEEDLSEKDILTMMPNLCDYMNTVYSLSSDNYSSMGALSLDVPDFSVINSCFGFEYGRKLLVYIADTLVSIFGKALVFRTWDAEFVVLFPNTIQEVFNGRCTRLRSILHRRYPQKVRVGSVWSEGVFIARNLVQEAQAVMRSQKLKNLAEDQDSLMKKKSPFAVPGVSSDRFVPYFQPKVDMRDGRLIGAEALARGIAEDGSIVPPVQFVDSMEKEGTIRDLDLFMLDSVLRRLSDWKRRGLPVIKVSINMSRITLFNPTILASVLAIQSRYPEIPADRIELEITETAGNIEKATLACIVDNFRECGIGFELDDFGSGYANMSVFSNIKFQTIKLDRSLVNDIPNNDISRMLVENIVRICNNFGMTCIAEGVETAQQEKLLLEAGCAYGQGYYYARPLPAEDFEKNFLTKGVWAPNRR